MFDAPCRGEAPPGISESGTGGLDDGGKPSTAFVAGSGIGGRPFAIGRRDMPSAPDTRAGGCEEVKRGLEANSTCLWCICEEEAGELDSV